MSLVEFDPPDRFVVGTVGMPGKRTFFVQAAGGGRLVSAALEKLQVQALAERVGDLLDEMVGPAVVDAVDVDNEPLTTPIEEDFRVSAIALSWDAQRKVVVVEAYDRDPDDPEEGPARGLRAVLAPGAARAFGTRALAVVAQGRPACPFCSGPIDPVGHVCPRANGYRR